MAAKMNDKETIRAERLNALEQIQSISGSPGKTAEQLRKSAIYRESRRLFVTPSPLLLQIRINCLLDGKELLMPSPALRDGFLLIKPHEIAFNKLAHAVTFKGSQQFGTPVAVQGINTLFVDLVVCDAVAVDIEGTRLGDGQGFLDLACGLLGELGALGGKSTYLAVIEKTSLLEKCLPFEPWDIKMSGILTGAGQQMFSTGPAATPHVHWQALSSKKIRKSNFLWQLYNQTGPK